MPSTTTRIKIPLPLGDELVSRANHNAELQAIEDNAVSRTGDAITLYVRTDGDDENDGSADDADHALLTVQEAIDRLPDWLDADAIVYVAAGDYSADGEITIKGVSGPAGLYIYGDTSLSSSRIIGNIVIEGVDCRGFAVRGFDISAASAHAVAVASVQNLQLQYCQSDDVAAAHDGINVQYSKVYATNCSFSNKRYGVYAGTNAEISLNLTAGSSNGVALKALYGGKIINDRTNTITGTKYLEANGGFFVDFETGVGTNISGTSGTIEVVMDSTLKTITPTNDCTFTATGGVAGQMCTFVILTSGVPSYNMTWTTGFKSLSVLVTGTTSGVYWSNTFIFDGTYWVETSRRGPL
jgi:hypothetical protein